MAYLVESVSLKGLRKAHIRQLANYIHDRDREGWYYGPKEQFEKRHDDLIKWIHGLVTQLDDPDARMPK